MMKSFTTLAIMSLLGAAVIALPMFAPQVEAREPTAMVKADRLPVRQVHPGVRDCSQQVWPDFTTSCLRSGDVETNLREARLVTARR